MVGRICVEGAGPDVKLTETSVMLEGCSPQTISRNPSVALTLSLTPTQTQTVTLTQPLPYANYYANPNDIFALSSAIMSSPATVFPIYKTLSLPYFPHQ